MRQLLIILFLFLVSCTSKINVENGIFQAMKPPNIYGNSRYLENEVYKIYGGHKLEDDIYEIISFDANIGKNKTIPLYANINYRLIENALGFQYNHITKYEDNIYTGFGLGIQNFPYGFVMFGYNGKFIEIGGAAFFGFTIDNASYEGKWDYECGFMCDDDKYVKYKDIKVLHSYGGGVTHASFYWEKFAFNYAASISRPWFSDKIPIPKDRYFNADVSFSFPVLLMQDIGISYRPSNIKYRIGVNQITGVKFPGQYWGVSFQAAYAL